MTAKFPAEIVDDLKGAANNLAFSLTQEILIDDMEVHVETTSGSDR
jgi:hypothetical protein